MAKVELLAPILFQWEGGYQCDPDDKGNYNSKGELVGTKYGVSANAYEAHYDIVPEKEIMENLTPEQASFVLLSYWNNCKADDINSQSIANLFVDWYYMSGPAGIKSAQRVLNLVADSIVGHNTLATINAGDQSEVFSKLWLARMQFFLDICKNNPSQNKFLKGWLNRLNSYKFQTT
jgi:lysozyme family protein